MIEISTVIPARISCQERLFVFQRVLKNVTQQTLATEFYEVIIIDDGSEIALDTALEDIVCHAKNIALYRNQKKGPAASRNKGIQLAKGKVILFIGEDIIIKDNLLERHVKTHIYHNNCICVNPVYASNETRFGKGILETRFDNLSESNTYEMPTGGAFCTACVSIKKELMEKELFDENFIYPAYEDTDVGYRLHKRGVRFVVIQNTSAIHEHIHSPQSLLKRSRNCGHAFVYLSNKHPQLETGISRELAISNSIRKKFILSFVYRIICILNRMPFLAFCPWVLRIMCSYNFMKGIEEGRIYYAEKNLFSKDAKPALR